VVNDFLNDEVQKSLGEFRVEVGLNRQIVETRDLGRFARRIGRGKVVPGKKAQERAEEKAEKAAAAAAPAEEPAEEAAAEETAE
jgi:hypothetical protein